MPTQIVELDALVPDDIEFRYQGGEYVLPGDISVETTFRIQKLLLALSAAETTVMGGGDGKAQAKAIADQERLTLEVEELLTKLSAAGGGGTGGGPGPNFDDLLRQIGQLKLALGIQGAQQGILQSFAKGTLNVSQTGLALVHSGETITPAGSARGGGGEPIHVHVHNHVTVEDGAVNEDKIRAVAVSASDRISRVIGERAIERARSGRF